MELLKNRAVRTLIEVLVLLLLTVLIILTAKDYKETKKQEEKIASENSENEKDKVFDLWYSYTGYEPYLKEAALRYEKETGIKVRLTYYTTIDYLDKINDANIAGNGPDLFLMPEEDLQNAVLLGIAEQNYNTDLYNDDNFAKKAIESTKFLDKQYGCPLGFETTVFAANKAYADEMPKTFDEVKVFADNFNIVDEVRDYSNVSSILKWDISDIFYNYGFLGAYLNVCGENGDNPTIISVNTENAINAGKYYNSLAHYFYTDAAQAKYENVMNEFFEGKIVYTIASADIINRISQSQMNIELSVLPDLTDSLETKPVSVTDIVMVNPFADMKDEAKEFAKYLTYDMADEMYGLCGIISTKKTEYENQNINVFMDAYENSIGMPKLMTTADYWVMASNVLKSIWNGGDVPTLLTELYLNLDARINN